jgi:hypothetical protein
METICQARRSVVLLTRFSIRLLNYVKGISLTVDQYKALLEAIPEVNAHLGTLGVEVNASAVIDGGSEEEAEPQKRIKPKKTKKEEKANIEATSDEEDE